MKTILNTNLVPMFSGTYESIWDIVEYNEEGTEEVMVDYDQQDFMASIASAYQDNELQIQKDLNCTFLRGLHFTGKTYSPREYNFSTDELDFEVKLSITELLQVVKNLEANEEFKTFLHDHYTSYDGFMSLTPNNYRDFKEAIVNRGNDFDQALGSLIRYLAGKNLQDIEETVYEDWQGNGYGGLDYKIVPEE